MLEFMLVSDAIKFLGLNAFFAIFQNRETD